MSDGFSVYWDKWGCCFPQDGIVCEVRSGARHYVGGGSGLAALSADRSNEFLTKSQAALTTSAVGGSGRGLWSTGLEPRYSGASCPVGYWSAREAGTWRLGIFVLTVPASGDPEISDGTDVVAVFTGGSTAAGDYDSTSYGATNYGEIVGMVGQPFTLTVAAEGGVAVDIPDAEASVSAGTAEAGTYEFLSGAYAGDPLVWEHATAAGWTLTVATDGTAEISDGTDVVATRSAASPWSPEGTYTATTYGAETYNWVTADPDDPDAVDAGVEFEIRVSLTGRSPKAGVIYLTLTEVDGVLDAVTGPAFGASLPASTADTFHVPIWESDGLGGVEQLHTGMLAWRGREITWGTVASSTDAGSPGEIRTDGTYLYGCVAADTWGRIEWDLTSWP